MIEDYRVVSARIRQELKELDQVTFRADRAIAAAKRQPADQDLYIDFLEQIVSQTETEKY